jgi:hypothetical protein
MFPHQNAGHNCNIKIANGSFENVAMFNYLGKTLILVIKHLIHEEIKSRLNSCNACYHSIQKLLSSRLLSQIVKNGICKTTTLLVGLYGYKTCSLTLKEEYRLKIFESSAEQYAVGEDCIMRTFITCTLCQI